MDKYTDFKDLIVDVVHKFKTQKDDVIKVVSNFDSDGMSAAAILTKALNREKRKFSLSIIKQLTKEVLNEFSNEEYKFYIFADLGSGYLSQIETVLKNRTVIILDHHKPEKTKTSLLQVNPHLFNIDGSKEISASGISYLFARTLNPNNTDLAYISIIGAIGDVQENKGFTGLNQEILQDAVDSGKIEIKQGLRMFGLQTKPLHKVLEYSTDPYIPNVTGNEQGAISFLYDIGIEPKVGNKWKKLIHLDEQDMKKLVTGVILKRIGSEKKPEDVLGPIYLLKEEDEESPTKDAKEFSTLLNSCGRMKKPSIGIGACLNDKEAKQEAIKVLGEYKLEIIKALNWFHSNKSKLIEKTNYVIINAEDNINDSIIGTLTSMIARANLYKGDTILLSMAYTLDDKIKVSIRKVGHKPDHDINLLAIIKEITQKVGGEAGGHPYFAAGALIPQEKEEEFINVAQDVLDKITIKEK